MSCALQCSGGVVCVCVCVWRRGVPDLLRTAAPLRGNTRGPIWPGPSITSRARVHERSAQPKHLPCTARECERSASPREDSQAGTGPRLRARAFKPSREGLRDQARFLHATQLHSIECSLPSPGFGLQRGPEPMPSRPSRPHMGRAAKAAALRAATVGAVCRLPRVRPFPLALRLRARARADGNARRRARRRLTVSTKTLKTAFPWGGAPHPLRVPSRGRLIRCKSKARAPHPLQTKSG